MILTCPNCSAQFAIDPNILGDEGKTVRCSACKHTWLQMPDAKSIIEDIPEGVKPLPEDDQSEEKPKAKPKKPLPVDQRNSIVASVGFFILCGFILLAFGFFSGGAKPSGDGLSFDKITVALGDHDITVAGVIINLTAEEKKIPHIKATVKDKEQAIVAEWLIALPEKTIQAESTLPFSAVYPEHIDHAENLTLSF